MVKAIKRFLGDFKRTIKLYEDVPSIARRMFVTNSFDGILAAIGVNVGGFSGDANPFVLASSIIGGGVSMGVISGVIGVYLSERAERVKEVIELEKKVSARLRDSIYWRAALLVPIYVALWSGVGIVLFPTLIAAPYLLAYKGLVGMNAAYISSLAIALGSLAWLGSYLGKVSGESVVKSTMRAVLLGLMGIGLVYLVKSLLGGFL
ncbi:MAG: hypothetical protein GSR85_03935 [Desulfurococcales archaeon]|nr:hypothetical protein [Desulfurococcales archaeon]